MHRRRLSGLSSWPLCRASHVIEESNLKPLLIPIRLLVLTLVTGASHAAHAAGCPVAHPVTGAFHAIQVSTSNVVTYAPSTPGTLPVIATEVQRGVTLSGSITGLDLGSPQTEMGLAVQLDLVRYMRTGQGYGAGEITITTRPPVPFLQATTAFHGRVNAVVTSANVLSGYFAAVGDGDFAGSSLRGRFTARLTVATGTPNPGVPSNPLGGNPLTNPLGGGGGLTNPFGGGSLTNPLGGGSPSNPLGSGSTGSGLTNPLTGTPVGGGTSTSLPGGNGTTVAIQMDGAFGGPAAPAILVENDPVPIAAMADPPNLAALASGVFPLVQPSTGRLTATCRGGDFTFCPPMAVPPDWERTETRQNSRGAGTIKLRSGRATASYRVEVTLDSTRTISGTLASTNYGYAQGRVRLFGRGTAPIYVGTLDGTLTPLFSRGKPVKGRFLWSGFLTLNLQTPSGAVTDSMRSAFTAVGTLGKGAAPVISLDAALGDANDPFVRVLSGLR
jgi:hypothetical protein